MREKGGFFMFAKKKDAKVYDKTGKVPVLRASICTGEKTAAFKDPLTGRLEEQTLIATDADLQAFLRKYGLSESDLKHEW